MTHFIIFLVGATVGALILAFFMVINDDRED